MWNLTEPGAKQIILNTFSGSMTVAVSWTLDYIIHKAAHGTVHLAHCWNAHI